MATEPRFDTEAVFDDDYLYFYGDHLAKVTDAEAERIWRLLELEPGMAVLDVPCGHGRIANRIAARGCCVTGLDATPQFLDLARRDAAERGVEVTYVHGDMRALEWTEAFDRVVNWFTSFGYFPDEENRQVLAEAHRVLRPGGKLLIETQHQPVVLCEPRNWVVEQDGDWLVDHHTYEPLTGRIHTTRIVIRGDRSRTMRFFVRILGFPELRDWLLAAGFSRVDGYGPDGEPLTADSRRMLAVATR
ncbi:MAG: SAM-dependent methyltransferase [Egibacteraceae bacterium]